MDIRNFFAKKVAPAPISGSLVTAATTEKRGNGNDSAAEATSAYEKPSKYFGKKLALPKRKDPTSVSAAEPLPALKKSKSLANGETILVVEADATSVTNQPDAVIKNCVDALGLPNNVDKDRLNLSRECDEVMGQQPEKSDLPNATPGIPTVVSTERDDATVKCLSLPNNDATRSSKNIVESLPSAAMDLSLAPTLEPSPFKRLRKLSEYTGIKEVCRKGEAHGTPGKTMQRPVVTCQQPEKSGLPNTTPGMPTDVSTERDDATVKCLSLPNNDGKNLVESVPSAAMDFVPTLEPSPFNRLKKLNEYTGIKEVWRKGEAHVTPGKIMQSPLVTCQQPEKSGLPNTTTPGIPSDVSTERADATVKCLSLPNNDGKNLVESLPSAAMDLSLVPTLEPSPFNRVKKLSEYTGIKEVCRKGEAPGKIMQSPLVTESPTVPGKARLGMLIPCSSNSLTPLPNHSGKGPVVSADEGHLWTSKYRPRCSADLVGNPQLISRLREWLLKWDSNHLHAAGGASSSKGRGKPSEDNRKAALMSGPPGIGKTSSATILSQELGYNIVEVNASDSRGKADGDLKQGVAGRTSNKIKELITNHCMAFGQGASMSAKKMVLIMDEVDGMSGGDRGGVQDLIKSIKAAKIPIICICNDKYNRKLQSLVNHCMELNFQKPTKPQICRRLIDIAKKENLQVDERTLEALLDSVQCDIRLALNHMQFIGAKVLPYADTVKKAQERAKDVALSPFNAAERLLSGAGKDMSLEDRINLVFQDADLVPLLIQENYVNYCPFGEKRDGVRIEMVSRAADTLCIGDVVNKVVRQHQRWDLMPLACVESAVACSAIVCGSRETFFPSERSFLRFSGWLGKNSSAGKNVRLLSNTQLHLLVSGNCPTTRTALRLDYMPQLCRSLVLPLREREKEGVEQVIGVMEEYCLSREDRDAILEISQLKGQKDPMEGISVQVKSTFTRLLNQRASERIVKSSILLDDIKVNKGHGTSQIYEAPDNDLMAVDELGEIMEEELLEGKQDDATVIPGVRCKNSNKTGVAGPKSKRGQSRGGRGRGAGRGGKSKV